MMMMFNTKNQEMPQNDSFDPVSTALQRGSLKFRLSVVLLLAPLAPVVIVLLGLYYLFRNYLNAEFASATAIVIVLAVIIVVVFLIVALVNIFFIRKYVTVPIMTLVDRVSRFRHITDSPELQAQNQTTTGSMDDIKRSAAGFRTVEGMANRIRQLELEIDKIYYDPLTGIYNRRYLNESFERILHTLSRSKGVLSVLMVDIDHFKNYNDLYGHLQGDECLRLVAKAIIGSIERADDFAARYGGEEFAVVLPSTDKAGALHIANAILYNIRALKIPHGNTPIADHVTVSIGITSGNIRHTHKAEDFLKCADDMLYESKQNGRNMLSYCDLE